jgi:hypothetical protein
MQRGLALGLELLAVLGSGAWFWVVGFRAVMSDDDPSTWFYVKGFFESAGDGFKDFRHLKGLSSTDVLVVNDSVLIQNGRLSA